ncbi:hypothetical protein ACPOL_1251 [Acidisarcina polymorpha]|uniref:Uncharacterized protein n=1 Tax=Acidisarcina polymorpha TaxID=2211140 RepID=A0A2Z5FUP4_9BACT|nr:hypothetical protein ACPOL_1251 [Acidisarcina polymorpha]
MRKQRLLAHRYWFFYNGAPRTLARYLIEHHAVTEARARGLAGLENGDLLNEAEAAWP